MVVRIKGPPCWRNLNHFDRVMNKSFNDGSKHEDIVKMMLFVAHNIFIDNADLLLLQALQCYLDYRTSLSYEVHTTETIAEGGAAMNPWIQFEVDPLLQEYISACEGSEKNWNFPKFHACLHAFDGIEKKGATRNKAKRSYARVQLTRPIIIIQLMKHDHRRTVAKFIWEQIEALEKDEEDAPEDLEAGVLSNVDIGSKLKVVSYSALEQAESGDPSLP
ncbi:hypothetical protein B0H17DRAFT_1133603 [Mycena rosella]|uniref:Uncharacterized protein n=1 Tax=Mycena rosella TaxID=1033263 RepID=A0AAD7DHN8_MYCRO|nr:hypothetical protein B0H17DRAFT_1133603 [Mycena rosella]